ncbi:MAG: hypothetical protein PHR47_03760 [Candidatus Pacebacteria bacterium]|nr:hypothetical protein [Candidatus Paceibacterota bacterium]
MGQKGYYRGKEQDFVPKKVDPRVTLLQYNVGVGYSLICEKRYSIRIAVSPDMIISKEGHYDTFLFLNEKDYLAVRDDYYQWLKEESSKEHSWWLY